MYCGGLCFITDLRDGMRSYEDMVRLVLDAGATWIQYRDKESSGRDLYRTAEKLRIMTRDYNAVFIVNDRTDIARVVEADGVHLGQDDLPADKAREILGRDRLIGLSTHTVEQAVDAEASGVDYIGVGPIFHTQTKDAGPPRGIHILQQVRQHVKMPIVAIGGITLENMRTVLDTGIDAVAVSSAILSGSIQRNVKAFYETIAAY